MSTPRIAGIGLCLLGFAAVCFMAFASTMDAPWAGMQGIQRDISDEALTIVVEDAPGATVTTEGRELTIELPEFADAGFDRAALQTKLAAIDGVRSVKLIGDPTIGVGIDDAPAPLPTEAPIDDPEPTTEPTAEPTAAPTVEPTAAPTPEPTVEPTTAPTAEPTTGPVAPTLAEVVDGIDLGAVRFETGSARLTAQDTAVLDAVADALQGQTEGSLQVQAHTSNQGDPDVNLLLSQDRANAVVAYLIDRGVEASLLSARGFGSIAPIADNSTEQGRAANQRVVLVVEGN